jgi:hypothetical protein
MYHARMPISVSDNQACDTPPSWECNAWIANIMNHLSFRGIGVLLIHGMRRALFLWYGLFELGPTLVVDVMVTFATTPFQVWLTLIPGCIGVDLRVKK